MVFPSVDTVVVVPPKCKPYAMQLAVENMAQWQVVALCHRIPVACSHAASWMTRRIFRLVRCLKILGRPNQEMRLNRCFSTLRQERIRKLAAGRKAMLDPGYGPKYGLEFLSDTQKRQSPEKSGLCRIKMAEAMAF
jgi:hypothetical protein